MLLSSLLNQSFWLLGIVAFGASTSPDSSEWGSKHFLLKVATLSGNEFLTWQRLKRDYCKQVSFKRVIIIIFHYLVCKMENWDRLSNGV